MDFEVSQKKPRPLLPRRTDVEPTEPRTDRERLEGRNEDGTASVGNKIAKGRGWKARIRRIVRTAALATNTDIAPTDEHRIEADTDVVYMGILSEAPTAGPLVRMNAASCALEYALAGFYHAKAVEAGLLTDLGEKLETRATTARQRAERLSVTVHMMSQRPKAGAKKRRKGAWVTAGDSEGGQTP